jgi:anti-sigma-K factor RskA
MTREEMQALAGEYVLGLLDDAEHQKAEHAMANDEELRRMVRSFANHMSRLDAPPDKVPEGMWERISAELEKTPQEGARPASNVVPLAKRAPTWSRLALAASLLAALGLGYLGGRFVNPEPQVVVVLMTPENAPGAVFEAYADNAVRIVPLRDFVVPEGKIMQVWTLYDKAVGPVSLGTLDSSKTAVLGANSFPVPTDNQLYEITLEPAPGSPTGKPTGPILVKGFAKRPPS